MAKDLIVVVNWILAGSERLSRDQSRFRAITSAAASRRYDSSGAAKAWVSSAFSRSKAAASTRSLSRRIKSRMYSLTFSNEPPLPTLAATKSPKAPPRRTVIFFSGPWRDSSCSVCIQHYQRRTKHDLSRSSIRRPSCRVSAFGVATKLTHGVDQIHSRCLGWSRREGHRQILVPYRGQKGCWHLVGIRCQRANAMERDPFGVLTPEISSFAEFSLVPVQFASLFTRARLPQGRSCNVHAFSSAKKFVDPISAIFSLPLFGKDIPAHGSARICLTELLIRCTIFLRHRKGIVPVAAAMRVNQADKGSLSPARSVYRPRNDIPAAHARQTYSPNCASCDLRSSSSASSGSQVSSPVYQPG